MIEGLKQKYNKTLTRYYSAATYMDNKEIPFDERYEHFGKFREIITELNSLVVQIKATGCEMCGEQIREGFK